MTGAHKAAGAHEWNPPASARIRDSCIESLLNSTRNQTDYYMSGFPNSPRLIKGGIVTMDPDTSAVLSVIALQYNPDSLTRSLQIQAMPGGQDGVRVDALRLRGPAVETIKLEAELDATDQLEFPTQNPNAVQYGLQPQLAQLEMLVNPTIETLEADDAMANAGTLEIIPLEQPLTLFVWSSS